MTNKQIQDYMHTIVSGLKAAGGGELSKVRKLVTQALSVANEAKSKAARAVSAASAARDVADGAAEKATTAADAAAAAQSAANSAKNTASAVNECIRFKSQDLTDTQKRVARYNIGAGTGNYSDLTGRPVYRDATEVLRCTPSTQLAGLYYTTVNIGDTLLRSDTVYSFERNGEQTSSRQRVKLETSTGTGYIYMIGNLRLLDGVPSSNLQKLLGYHCSVSFIYWDNFVDTGEPYLVVRDGVNSINVISNVSEEVTVYEITSRQLSDVLIPDTIQRVGADVIIPSSTADSTKRFKITVDDSGTLSATEVT